MKQKQINVTYGKTYSFFFPLLKKIKKNPVHIHMSLSDNSLSFNGTLGEDNLLKLVFNNSLYRSHNNKNNLGLHPERSQF